MHVAGHLDDCGCDECEGILPMMALLRDLGSVRKRQAELAEDIDLLMARLKVEMRRQA